MEGGSCVFEDAGQCCNGVEGTTAFVGEDTDIDIEEEEEEDDDNDNDDDAVIVGECGDNCSDCDFAVARFLFIECRQFEHVTPKSKQFGIFGFGN